MEQFLKNEKIQIFNFVRRLPNFTFLYNVNRITFVII